MVQARISDPRVEQFWDKDHLVAKELRQQLPAQVCCQRNGVIWDFAALYPNNAQWGSAPVYFGGAVLDVAGDVRQHLSAMSADTAVIAETIKTDVAQLVAGINAHDVVTATAYDAPNIISMECGSPSTVGIEADKEGFKMGFAHDPLWKISLIDETVDVASSRDLAVYRGTYNENNSRADVLLTHKTNFIAEFKRQSDGSWRIVWDSFSNMEQSHPLPEIGEDDSHRIRASRSDDLLAPPHGK